MWDQWPVTCRIGHAYDAPMVVLRFHLDVTDQTAAFWWIDSPQVPNLYASAASLIDARRQAMDELDAAGVDVDANGMRYEMV